MSEAPLRAQKRSQVQHKINYSILDCKNTKHPKQYQPARQGKGGVLPTDDFLHSFAPAPRFGLEVWTLRFVNRMRPVPTPPRVPVRHHSPASTAGPLAPQISSMDDGTLAPRRCHCCCPPASPPARVAATFCTFRDAAETAVRITQRPNCCGPSAVVKAYPPGQQRSVSPAGWRSSVGSDAACITKPTLRA